LKRETSLKLTKQLLREAGRAVLERRGEHVDLKPGPGVVPGARLLVSVDGVKTSRTVSVRTSQDRELGLMRNDKGDWRTIGNVAEVLVAAPAEDNTSIEVMSFTPEVLINAFNNALNKRPKLKRDQRLPLFLPLDDKRLRRSGAVISGLKDKSTWRETITPDDDMLRKSAEKFSSRSFVDRVKREFAELNGVDVSRVTVEFRILS
jgi:hypothetical protein